MDIIKLEIDDKMSTIIKNNLENGYDEEYIINHIEKQIIKLSKLYS